MATTQLTSGPPEEKDNPAQEEFDKIIDRSFSPEEKSKLEEQALNGNGEDSQAASDKSGVKDDSLSAEDLKKSETSNQTDGSSGSLYKPSKFNPKKLTGRLNGSYSLKKYLIVGGFAAAFLSVIVLLFSFLNVFKLDGLMSSIESRAFLRTNATLDTRSSKWVSSYIEARMLDMGNSPNFDNPDFKKDDNLLFRATRVDTNSPFTDWYKTLRASRFEQDVFEKHGIKFTSVVTADGKFRPGLISINGEKPIPISLADMKQVDFDKLSKGDVATIRKFGDIVDTRVFNSNKEARKAIKGVVKNGTRWDQVYKRRALRKSIQNMTGVKDWRFFETTRDKLAQKRVDIRTKIIDKMVPDKILIGRVTRCLFGVDKCSASRDVGDLQTHAIVDENIGTPNQKTDQQIADEKKNLGNTDTSFTPGELSDTLKKVLEQANLYLKILNLPSTLDMITYVNDNIPKIVKWVVIARGAQAAGLFQVFETSRDQLKAGQVTSQEVNDMMNVVSTAGSSDAQVKVIDGKGDPGVASSDIRCSEQARARYDKDPVQYKKTYGVYAPLCADQRVSSAANAQKVQAAYTNTVGNVVSPIATIWKGANNTPLLGQFISVVRWFGAKINWAVSFVADQALSILGLKGDVQAAITWVFGKVSNFLGVVILNGNELPGTIFNWLVQGGAYTAESANRQDGAAVTTPASLGAAQNAIAQYQTSQREDSSLYNRVASLDNPDSLGFKGVTALSNVQSDPSSALMSGLHNLWSGMGKNFGTLFGGRSFAAAPDGYAASKFADIETYDYPQQCYDLDPIASKPMDGTNALAIFQQNGIPVSQANLDLLNSWDTETNGDSFYKVIYDVIRADSKYSDSADDVAVHIYNCNLLDTAVRGSLGYIYGYTKDNNDLAQ